MIVRGAQLSELRERYELRGELARGGMAVVHRAYDRLAQREIAYKRVQLVGDVCRAAAVALFEREYDVLARLRHPSVVRVYEYGLDAIGPYYTMELLEGSDLFASAPLQLEQAALVIRDVASALSLMHARRLVHRDVTPKNVRFDAEQRTKLIDFGALASFGHATEVVGTPPFMAPECLRQEPLDARSDLFSLGALAYYALSRKLAIPARSLEDRLYDLTPSIVPLSLHVPGLPRELEVLVHALLSPDPLARPSSAAEVMRALSTIVGLPSEREQREVAFSYLAHPTMVGQRIARGSVSRSLHEVRDGATQVLDIQGVDGSGRTALLDQLAVDAQLSGIAVLRAQGTGRDPAFAAVRTLMQAAAAWNVRANIALRSSAPPSTGVDKRRVDPRLATTPVELAERHAARVDAFQQAMLDLCERDALVILIDDAELIDPDSMAVLASLTQHAGERKLLLALSSTPTVAERGSALALLRQAARRVALDGLSADEVLELVRSIFGDVPNVRRLGLWLAEQSAGVPGRAMQGLRALLDANVLRYEAGSFQLPHDFDAHAIGIDDAQRRVRQLPLEALRVAQILALQRERLALEVVAEASDLEGPRTLVAIEALRARELVRIADGEVWIVDAAVRTALEATLEEASRKNLHLRIGHALAHHDEGSERSLLIAANLLRGGDQEAGAEMLTRALSASALGLDLGIDSAAAMPLLEELLAARRRAGEPDEANVDLLTPLTSAGYLGDYRIQCLHGDRALSALLNVTGLRLAKQLQRFMGGKVALVIGVCFALIRRRFSPRLRRTSLRDLMRSLLAVASGGVASAVSAFDTQKAFQIVDSLSPFAALPERSAPRVAYEFARGTAEVGGGYARAAATRYQKLGAILEDGPIEGLAVADIEVFRWASLYGRAHAEVTHGSPAALEIAEQLRHGHPFYRAPAEMTRMAHYAFRGDQNSADRCREQAELAALRNRMSWSSVSIMTVRAVYAYLLSRNVSGLRQSAAELTRLSASAPALSLFRQIAESYVALLEGHAQEAARGFELVLHDPRHASLPTAWINRTLYAEVLRALGRYEEARQLCLASSPIAATATWAITAATCQCSSWRWPKPSSPTSRPHASTWTTARASSPRRTTHSCTVLSIAIAPTSRCGPTIIGPSHAKPRRWRSSSIAPAIHGSSASATSYSPKGVQRMLDLAATAIPWTWTRSVTNSSVSRWPAVSRLQA
jgi:hypothetical protein